MPSQYPYRRTIRNEYLGVSKVIRAMTANELHWLVEAQLTKWSEQETRKRQQQQKEAERQAARQHAENLKWQAEEDTKTAQQNLQAFQTILSGSLHNNLALDWELLLARQSFRPFQFTHPKPNKDEIRLQLLGPEPRQLVVAAPVPEIPGFWEFLLPFLRRRRLERQSQLAEAYKKEEKKAKAEFANRLREYHLREKEVVEAYNFAVHAYNNSLNAEKEKYLGERNEFLAEQKAHNSAVLAFRSRYEAGSAEAVEQYIQMVLERSSYPEPIVGEPDVRFDEASKTLIVNFWLPAPAEVPNIVECKYIASRRAIKPSEMKQKDFQAFYDEVIHQIALRTAHEVFVADYARWGQAVVFNGWVQGIDRQTGKPFTSCILSYEAPHKQFMDLDLAQVAPKECIRGLKGITAGPLIMLAPVKPIMELKRDDDRFVESKEVLDRLRPEDNLAAMEWEDFEHLVRQLFEKEFGKTGGEVRVTQASRDRGVDAIAFDPDPIRGGKFVIQAKRYNMVVPVSAVRDLYGTMIAEGATKGILVTTSYYGRDSREFAKDKPMTLIDGENLVHMFQKSGHNLHIALLPKGDPRRGLGSAAE
jgi:restriction system protein